MDEKNQVFINLSGEDAKQKGFLLRQASQIYNRQQYSQWLHILSSIHESIFHKIAEDNEELDILYGECIQLQKYWDEFVKNKGYGWEIKKELGVNVGKYVQSIRNYSRTLMLELNRQGYFPNRKTMSETRLE